MIEKSLYNNYNINFSMDYETKDDAYYFIFNSNRELYYPKDNIEPTTFDELDKFDINFKIYIGTYKDKDVFVVNANDGNNDSFIPLFKLFELNRDDYQMAARAILVSQWYSSNQYCGKCGTKTMLDKKDMMLLCPKCGQMHYTRIAPAIIVAINKDGKLLMAKHSYYSRVGYTILAGFVEAGENLEEAVKREVLEEVGIKIKNVQYQRSQSWPFPNSLMLGFTADYESGEIAVDQDEILDAKWFDKRDIPRIESDISISSWLINNFKETH